MKICAIGDPHGDLEKIKKIPLKDVDLILLTGDLGKADLARKMSFDNIKRVKEGLKEIKYTGNQRKKASMESYDSTIKIINYLRKFAPVYTIFGNVEINNYKTRLRSKQYKIKLPFLANDLNSLKNVRVINNRLANFEGIKIGGLEYFIDTCWVKEFKPSNFEKNFKIAKKDSEKAKKTLNWFNSLDILLCHQPPYKILDKVTASFAPKHWQGKHAGSKVILEYIKNKNPKYVFCGHIHEAYGNKKIGKTTIYNLGVAEYKIIEV
jgi:Icc-related predicted phosphoesterase